MQFDLAPDIQKRISDILGKLDLPYIDPKRVICFRSTGSSSMARARIWSFPTIWQKALRIKPHYALEVLGEKFDHLHDHDQTRVLIHELMHIPKNFSGALLPHRGRGKRKIDYLSVEQLFRQYRAHR